MTRIEQQNGYILLPVVLLISLVATLAFMLNHESAQDTGIVGSLAKLKQSEYVAQAGLQHSLQQIVTAGCGPYTDFTDKPFGIHKYSTTITPNNAGGMLTTIPVPVSDDAWIKSDMPDQNYGNDAQLNTYFNLSPSTTQRTLYRFDIENSGISTGALVASAVARIFMLDSNAGASVNIYQITADWTEASVNWDNINSSHDFSSIASIPTGSPVGQYVDVNITPLVQGWINGSIANQGIMLKTTFIDDLAQYTSKEYGNTSQRPELIIKVSDGSLSNRADVTATGTLASGTAQTLNRSNIKLYQNPPSSLSLQPDAMEGKDAEIWDQAPNNNYSNAAETWVSSASNDTTRSLLRFNMGAIPHGAKILEATLSLHRQSGSGADQPVSAHRITNSWNEDSVTWNSRESGTNWDTAGTDFDNMAVATTPVGPVNQRYEWNIKPLVQGWVDGSYPNYGIVLVAAIAGMPGEKFNTSDHTDSSRWPSLSISYACECGVACQLPQGSGKVLLVVGDNVTLAAADSQKKALFESWGYSINLIDDDADQATFDAALVNNDVAYISETVWGPTLANKLATTDKGVVSEEEEQNSRLGLSTSGSNIVNKSMEIIDNSHYITALFPNSVLPIFSAPMEGMLVTGTPAPGLQTLGNFSGTASLALVDGGDALQGGDTAPGRRVAIPIGSNDKFNWNYLNNNGRLIVQRAIQWGTGNIGGAPPKNLLLVVVDPASLTVQEAAKKGLIESWGYAVNVIDVDDSQAAFDTAVTNNDVVFITEDIASSALGTKLVNATIGVVTEEDNLSDEFGMASNIVWDSSSTTIDIKDPPHYITEPFGKGILTILSTAYSLAYVDITLSPDLFNLASTNTGPALVALSAGTSHYLGGTVAGRRVQLPWGANDFDVNNLTADGLTLLQRSLEWGVGVGADGPPGPIAHWKLDDGAGSTAVDSEGSHDGTLAGNPTWTTGTLGDALNFDGAGDRVDVGPILDAGAPQISVTAWVFKRDTGDDRVISKSSSTARTDHIFSLGVAGTTIRTRLRTTDNGGTSDYDGGSIPLDQWVHLAFTYDGGMLRIYMGGTETASYAVTGDMIASTLDVAIGNVNATDDRYWNGLLDDVRIYDRALSSVEIADLATQGGGGGGSPTIVEVRVTTGNDDAEERLSNGNVGLTSSDLELISDGSNAQLVGMRFTGVAVPNGATITNAYIQFQVDETNTSATNVNIQGETGDSALQFTSSDYDISSRSKTTASIPWTPVSWTTVDEAGPDQRTPDISAVVQEIVNRTGWASGNDMVILISGSGERTAESYNGDSSGAALLHIEY